MKHCYFLFAFSIVTSLGSIAQVSLCFDPALDNRYETLSWCMDVAVTDMNNDGHLDVLASRNGDPTSLNRGQGDGSFLSFESLTYSGGDELELRDMNEDGILDVIRYQSGNLVVALNNGDGTLQPNLFTSAAVVYGATSELDAGDVTGDGHVDAVVNDEGADQLIIYQGDGSGGISTTFTLPTLDSPTNMSVGDVNGDGDDDIICSYSIGEDISLFLSDGDGTFTAMTIHAGAPIGSGLGAIEVADIDGDTDVDILVSGLTSLYVLENDGSENFTSLPDVFMGSYAYGFITGDWDNDDDIDVAWANQSGGGVTINLNNGDGTFPANGNVFYSSNGNSNELASGDFNEDGNVDLVVANGAGGNFAFLKGYGDGKFGSLSLLAAYGAKGLCVADFNNDLAPDVIMTNYYNPSKLALSLNNGDGSFADTQFLPNIGNAGECVAGDFNEDDNMDIAVHSPDGYAIHLGNGDGTFDAWTTFPTANTGEGGDRTIALGDFNGDGHQDLAGSRPGADNCSVIYGDGTGNFTAPDEYPGAGYPRTLLAGKLNNDTYDELVVCHNTTDEVWIYFGNNIQTLDAPLVLDTPGNPEGLAILDATGDGFNDLAVCSPNSNKIYLFPGNNDGTFDAAIETDTPTGSNANRLAVADINNDGNMDLIAAFYQSDAAGVFLGTGSGSFNSAISYGVDQGPSQVLTADFNGDGAMDFATLNSSIFNASVVLNNSAFIQSSGELAMCAGEEVTLTASEGYSYLWSDGSETQSITTGTAGAYYCEITNQAGTCTLLTPTVDVEVFTGQTVSLDLDSTLVCVENGSFFLTGGYPFGGQYTGSGITANVFDPSVAGEGTITITYTYVDAGECTNGSATDEIIVDICALVAESGMESHFNITPTLASQWITMENSNEQVLDLVITDQMGKIIWQGLSMPGISRLEIESWASGLYSIHSKKSNKMLGRFMKE